MPPARPAPRPVSPRLVASALTLGVVAGAVVLAWPRPSTVQVLSPGPIPTAAPRVMAAVSEPLPGVGARPTEAPTDLASATAKTAVAERDPVSVHVVAPGETLAGIAAAHGLRPDTLLWANDLEDPSLLRPGQELRVPAHDGVLYAVHPGDSLRALAERADIPLERLVAANRLADPDLVAVGTELVLPDVSPSMLRAGEGVQAAASVAPPKPLPVTYEVQPGDTLAALGPKFGVDLDTLLAANDVSDPNLIRSGTVLRILPVAGLEHEVQPGERLADIAARYHVASGLIFDFNRIADPDLIRPGERLLIPGGKREARAALPAGAVVAAPERPAVTAVPAPTPAGLSDPPAPKPDPPSAPAAKPAAAVPSSGPLGPRIAAAAQQYVGAAYVWGGTGPSGFDCSGLVWYVLKQVGTPISRGLWGQYNAGPHPSQDQLQPGDLVFFQNTYLPGLSHDGIYIGNGLMVNAVDEASGVKIQSIDSPYWASRWFGATRVS